jgi:uncharacterized protein YqhQ
MAEKMYYGGQAVVEGVMMRGQKTMVTAVRRPDGGLAIDTQTLAPIYTGWLRRTPLLRGVIVLIESMVLAVQTLLYSANVSLEDEDEKISGGLVWVMLIVAFAFAIALFFLVPLFLTRRLDISSPILFSLVDGLIRVVIFVLYLWLMAFLPDIRRTFAYHGAEHKTINAYEAGIPLEIESIKKYSTAHVRCSTSFLFVVLLISIFVFALTGIRVAWLMFLSRIVLIPVIAGLSYEVIYFGGRHAENRLVRILLAPGLWLQSLTTREPDDGQLEVALTALKRDLEVEEAERATPPSP